LEGDTYRKYRQAMYKIGGAIQWIDDPVVSFAYFGGGFFFGDESRLRVGFSPIRLQ
jgi:hypothetical protein